MIIDISPLLSPRSAVWPGDTPLTRNVSCDIATGANIDLSNLHSTVHLGAHADAPRHYHRQGATIDAVDLAPYVGSCILVSVLGKHLIEVSDCAAAVKSGHTRVLFRTLSAKDSEFFNEDFAAFTPEAMEFMGKNGVTLVGIDTPSVDPFASKDLPAHQMLFRYGMRNLEGLVLEHVADGAYELIALPLKLEGFDASPVRAVLRRK